MKNKKLKKNFTQVCVWPGTIVGEKIKEFEDMMKKELGVRIQYLEEIKTLPDIKNKKPVERTGNRNDLIFAVHKEDVLKFAVPRIQMGIRWIEDVFLNEDKFSIYPERIKEYRSW